ncbi:hypothetical protein OC845_003496 [Tilletia horrida]|nr:hypothetical protein OC845_003496 [Tilletia horrida]
MCCSERSVEVCRDCQSVTVEEGEAQIRHCHLWDDEDQDMHCTSLQYTTNQYVSSTEVCASCAYSSNDDDDKEEFSYARDGYYNSYYSERSSSDSSGGSSNDTVYSRYMPDSDDEDDSDDD